MPSKPVVVFGLPARDDRGCDRVAGPPSDECQRSRLRPMWQPALLKDAEILLGVEKLYRPSSFHAGLLSRCWANRQSNSHGVGRLPEADDDTRGACGRLAPRDDRCG